MTFNCDLEAKSVEIPTDRGVTGEWAEWAIADPVFGRIEGAAGQWRRAALLLAHPALGSQLRPCYMYVHDLFKPNYAN